MTEHISANILFEAYSEYWCWCFVAGHKLGFHPAALHVKVQSGAVQAAQVCEVWKADDDGDCVNSMTA